LSGNSASIGDLFLQQITAQCRMTDLIFKIGATGLLHTIPLDRIITIILPIAFFSES